MSFSESKDFVCLRGLYLIKNIKLLTFFNLVLYVSNNLKVLITYEVKKIDDRRNYKNKQGKITLTDEEIIRKKCTQKANFGS